MILHICVADKFIPAFITFIDTHFNAHEHEFIIFGGDLKKYPVAESSNTWYCNSRPKILKMLLDMQSADKIIIHGLFDGRLVRLLAIMPWLLKKCYWVMWGGDLYCKKTGEISNVKPSWRWHINEVVRGFVIKRMGHLVTYVPGDVELARKWYGATGKYHECIMYTSNVYRDYAVKAQPHATVNIQIGNSADPSNNHFEMLETLKPFREQDIAIYAPLSYGDQAHAKKVINAGKAIFGAKFKPMTDFMPFGQYLEFLGKIDIAVFAHMRQQGMGNTITLLGLGKKVFMRSDVTPWALFTGLGLAVYDVKNINLNPLDEKKYKENEQIISNYFSDTKLIQQYAEIFG